MNHQFRDSWFELRQLAEKIGIFVMSADGVIRGKRMIENRQSRRAELSQPVIIGLLNFCIFEWTEFVGSWQSDGDSIFNAQFHIDPQEICAIEQDKLMVI